MRDHLLWRRGRQVSRRGWKHGNGTNTLASARDLRFYCGRDQHREQADNNSTSASSGELGMQEELAMRPERPH
jgi:hypothetical protein